MLRGMKPRPPAALRYRGADAALDLRAPVVQHAPAVLDAMLTSLPELRVFMRWAHAEHTVDSLYDRIVAIQADYWRGGDLVFHLFDPADETLVGCAGLHRRTLNPDAFEVGYWIRSSHAGRGIATLATKCLLVLCFEHFGCERVQCGFNVDNHASARVGEKVGFRREGVLRRFLPAGTEAMRAAGHTAANDMVLTALLAEDVGGLAWYPAVRDALAIVPWDADPKR